MTMSDLRKAAEMALEALDCDYDYDRPYAVTVAMNALRAVLAEPDEVAAAVEAEREACKTFIRELEKRSWVDYDHANDPVDKGMAIGFSYSALIISMRSKP
jgi:hypothetical protein